MQILIIWLVYMKRFFVIACLGLAIFVVPLGSNVWATHEMGRHHIKKNIINRNKIKIIYPDNAPKIASDFGSMLSTSYGIRDQRHQGIDIKGPVGQPIVAIANGYVLDAVTEKCWGPTVVIDHGNAYDGKKIIALYGHLGEMLVKQGSKVSRGQLIGRLGDNEKNFRCIGRVRHLHFQIGQQYRSDPKNYWGWSYFLKDGRKSLNPHLYWADGIGMVTCFDPNKAMPDGYITYPVPCN